jgi:tRNA pseudouridine-54 N-methylase
MSDDATQKEQYALALLDQPDRDPFKAAMRVFPGDLARALVVSREWPQDVEVQARIGSMAPQEIDAKGVPTLNDLARETWKRVQKCIDHETAFKGIKELRELLYPKERGTTVNNNTLVDNRSVMVVTDHGTDDEWETKLRTQQEKLIADAARPITVN